MAVFGIFMNHQLKSHLEQCGVLRNMRILQKAKYIAKSVNWKFFTAKGHCMLTVQKSNIQGESLFSRANKIWLLFTFMYIIYNLNYQQSNKTLQTKTPMQSTTFKISKGTSCFHLNESNNYIHYNNPMMIKAVFLLNRLLIVYSLQQT